MATMDQCERQLELTIMENQKIHSKKETILNKQLLHTKGTRAWLKQ